MRELFVELLQVSLGTREKLSRVPSAVEWQTHMDETQWQAIAEILACGLEHLPIEQKPPSGTLVAMDRSVPANRTAKRINYEGMR